MSQPPVPELFFLRRPAGQRLCVHHRPAVAAHTALVHVHAFGEEMNKSRRMVALQCRALAEAGCAVLQIDLLGCGDSSGQLSDADWPAWLADVHAACDWMAQAHPGAAPWLWGQRAGALLASAACAQRPGATHLLLWQPMTAGKTLVQQLLRLKAAANLSDGPAAKAAMAALKTALADGQTVNVAGYPLPAPLVQALDAAELHVPPPGCQVRWLDVSSRPDATLAPVAAKTVAAWVAAGLDVAAQVVAGPAFWQSTEIEEAPLLLQASVAAVRSASEALA